MTPHAQEFYRDVTQLAAQRWGRDPEQLLVVPGVYPILGATEAEARQRKADLGDGLDLEYLKGSLASVLGVDADDRDLSRLLP
jgi:alkanesulfonate monooxygenase SsuD/methylene tetrahydromethanopterin reductase-like flavin-dependent oxidoreductase (luciferase family)